MLLFPSRQCSWSSAAAVDSSVVANSLPPRRHGEFRQGICRDVQVSSSNEWFPNSPETFSVTALKQLVFEPSTLRIGKEGSPLPLSPVSRTHIISRPRQRAVCCICTTIKSVLNLTCAIDLRSSWFIRLGGCRRRV